MKKIIVSSIFALIAIFFVVNKTSAAEELVFDSSDHYLGGCQLTNKAEWESTNDLNVSKFQIWYNWNQGESSINVTVSRDGSEFAKFEAKRSQCDPYQHQWCNADFQINKIFPKGKYTVEIPESRMCLKPGETGTVRLYANTSDSKKEEPKPTVTPALAVTNSQPGKCSCDQSTIIVTALVTSVATSAIVALLLRKA